MSLKNHAFATRKSYIRGLRELMLYYQKLPEDCSVDEIKAFLVYQRDDKQYSSSTVNLRVCGLKYYFRQVVHRLDLVVKIPNPRIQKYDTEVLTLEEICQLRRACRDMRQLLILNLLYDTGMRIREVIRLRVSDFDKHSRTITIRNSKGRKTRVVHYGEELRSILQRYCKVRKIRSYGFVANAVKAKKVALARKGLGEKVRTLLKRKERQQIAQKRLFASDRTACPCCKTGKMVTVAEWQRNKSPPEWVAPLIN